jgi:hypothetical protein
MTARRFNRPAWLVLMAALECSGAIGGQGGEIIVKVQRGGIPAGLLESAEAQAGVILQQAGATVKWELSGDGHEPAVASECSEKAIDLSVIEMQILGRTPENDHKGALGYARPFARSGVRVVIFYDRIVEVTPGPKLLGHVFAHEIGHVLIGTAEHASTGVMQAKWSSQSLNQLKLVPLRFTDDDTGMIALHFALQRRYCRTETVVASLR